MQVGLIAEAEIRNSDKYPAVNRLADLPGADGLALCSERHKAGRDTLVGLLFVGVMNATVAAGEAVLRELVGDGNDFKPHIVIAATHDGELVDLLKDRYAAYHFGDAIGPNGLTFDYHLLSDPATTRNAITLLQLQGAPESLVNRALARAADLDHERKATWAE